MRLDKKTKEIIKQWPLAQVKRWSATQDIFAIDFGEYHDGCYSVQTPEGDRISKIIGDYIDIICKDKEIFNPLRGADDDTGHDILEDDGGSRRTEAQTLDHTVSSGTNAIIKKYFVLNVIQN